VLEARPLPSHDYIMWIMSLDIIAEPMVPRIINFPS
jgi:hypothetical protein